MIVTKYNNNASIIIIGVSTTNKRIVSSDKFDYVYDYNYYITEDDTYYNDRNSN